MLLLSLVPLRWFIQILVDSRLMHFNKSLPEVWPTHLCPPCLSDWAPGCVCVAPSAHIRLPVTASRSTHSVQFIPRLICRSSSFSFLAAQQQIPVCCEFLLRWRRLWPPAVPCDPGAQGDKTSITLLYPPAHYQPQPQICPEPWGHSRRHTGWV